LDAIDGVIVTAHGVTYSNNLLVALAEKGAPLVVCGTNFAPVAVLMPLEGNFLQGAVLSAQAKAKETTLNRLWKDVVVAKIKQQAAVLDACGVTEKSLSLMAARVRSGDVENMEGQAAFFYFKALFGQTFRRDRDAGGINALLNYGYTVLRSAMIRAIVGSGLHPSLGMHHHNQYNAMRLADDLMEPYRPLTDFCVFRLAKENAASSVTAESKKRLAAVLSCTMNTADGASEVNYLMMKTASSYAKCVTGETEKLFLPPPLSEMGLYGL